MDKLIQLARRLQIPARLRALGFGSLVTKLNAWNLRRIRAGVASRHLKGLGLEIGALHFALPLPPGARAIYLDRASRDDNIRRYTDVNPKDIVRTDIVSDGFRLACIAPESLDFLVANHVLEHTSNTLGALNIWAGKIRPGGCLFITIPLAAMCFDRGRPITSLEHFTEDQRLVDSGDQTGFRNRNRDHYRDWVCISERNLESPQLDPSAVEARIEGLAKELVEIHFHTFSFESFRELLEYFCKRQRPDFRLAETKLSGGEVIALLKRADT